MQGVQLLEHNYLLYIGVWFIITLFILWFFRFMSRKMRNTVDKQTKSSLFTLTVFIGIPLLLAVVVGPMVFIIGDKNMNPTHMYIWIGLIGSFIIYFMFKQRSKNQ